MIPGDTLFKLYDTFGFPVDLTADIARERGLSVDLEGFEKAMEQQRERSRSASKFDADYSTGANVTTSTEFVGDKNLLLENTPESGKVIALYRDGKTVETLQAGETGSVILDRTPFYAESGGQIGDQGTLSAGHLLFTVTDTVKQGKSHVHIGKLEKGTLKTGDMVKAQVDAERRAATVLNHTATHLLHMVLREILGEHVTQKGSLVEPERLRFDFSHHTPLTAEEINRIEKRVNQEIRANHAAHVEITTQDAAIASGAMALFGEKYGAEVRVVNFGGSKELCGGTHAHHTGDIGIFKITSESGIAAGIRRIESVTGEGALLWLDLRDADARQKIKAAEDRTRQLEKQLEQVKQKLAGSMSQDLISQAEIIAGVKVLSTVLNDVDAKSLRNTVDQLKNKLGSGIIALGVVNEGKVSVIAGVTKDLTDKVKAGELVNMLAIQVGGKGGGRPDLAEAGGNQPDNLAHALRSVPAWVAEKLAK
jgi:alanyl-tRNA synthetase